MDNNQAQRGKEKEQNSLQRQYRPVGRPRRRIHGANLQSNNLHHDANQPISGEELNVTPYHQDEEVAISSAQKVSQNIHQAINQIDSFDSVDNVDLPEQDMSMPQQNLHAQSSVFDDINSKDDDVYEDDVYEDDADKKPVSKARKANVSSHTQKKKGSMVGWIVMGVLLVVLVAASVLLFLVLTDRVELGGSGSTSPTFMTEGSDPVLGETRDAGSDYVEETLFIGDSNTVRLGQFELVSTGRLAAQEAIGIEAVNELTFLMVGDGAEPLTAAQAAGVMQPRRIMLALGTNNIGSLSVEEFSTKYAEALNALRMQAPDADIVVSAILPTAQQNSYPHLTIESIAEYNAAIMGVCKSMGIPFLNNGESLADESGYLIAEYADADGVHLNADGLSAWLEYYRTHAWNP